MALTNLTLPMNNHMCTDDYSYWLQSFCLIDMHIDDPSLANNTSYALAAYFGVVILISFYFMKKAALKAM